MKDRAEWAKVIAKQVELWRGRSTEEARRAAKLYAQGRQYPAQLNLEHAAQYELRVCAWERFAEDLPNLPYEQDVEKRYAVLMAATDEDVKRGRGSLAEASSYEHRGTMSVAEALRASAQPTTLGLSTFHQLAKLPQCEMCEEPATRADPGNLKRARWCDFHGCAEALGYDPPDVCDANWTRTAWSKRPDWVADLADSGPIVGSWWRKRGWSNAIKVVGVDWRRQVARCVGHTGAFKELSLYELHDLWERKP